MWVNMKPHTVQLYNPIAVPYTVGITGKNSAIDQKTSVQQLKPGQHIAINVIPKIVSSSAEFNSLGLRARQCKLKHETNGLSFLNEYSRKGCELECAIKKATAFCRCLPWNYPNNFTTVPICDMFGAHCFDKVMSDETFYKKCQGICLEDCKGMALTMWHTFFPLNLEEICKEGHMIYEQIDQTFGKHFAFESYRALVEGGSIPNLAASYANGSLCKSFVKNYLSFVSVESPSTSVISSRREKRFSFFDQLGTIGGTLGLFTGMSLLSIADVLLFSYTVIKSIMKDFVQMFSTSDSQDKSVSSKNNEKDPIHGLSMDCCNKKKIYHNEEHIQNLYVSSWKSHFYD